MRIILKEIKYFIIVTFIYSWSIFFIVDGWLVFEFTRQNRFDYANYFALFGHMLAMFGPAIGAVVSWKIYKIGNLTRLRWSSIQYYLLAFVSCLLYWIIPGILYLIYSKEYSFHAPDQIFQWILIFSGFTLYWLAGIGEETGWCAFLIPVIEKHTTKINTIILMGALRGLWHLPLLIAPIGYQVFSDQKSIFTLIMMILFYSIQLVLSNIAFGSVFYWIWDKTKSLPLVGWLHQFYDAFRDISLILIINYVNSRWIKLYSGVIIAIIAGFILTKILTTEKQKKTLFN